MAFWDRELLYAEVWAEPVSLVARKYGISDVMLAKICRKLAIPVPGRGYWARKAAEQRPKQIPLRQMANAPAIPRPEKKTDDKIQRDCKPAFPPPDDPQFLRIQEMEGRTISVESTRSWHKSVAATEKRFSAERADSDGLLIADRRGQCLALNVSKNTLTRALRIMNAILVILEEEGFEVTVGQGMQETVATIFGQKVRFQLVERSKATAVSTDGVSGHTRKGLERTPTGNLELRVGDFAHGSWLRDRQKEPLEDRLPECLSGLLRCARKLEISAERERQRVAEERRQQEERVKLWREIEAEEARIKELDGWVNNWARAEQIRGFTCALEASWISRGVDVAGNTENGNRLRWMREQADRLDPLVENPPSILDRKKELRYW